MTTTYNKERSRAVRSETNHIMSRLQFNDLHDREAIYRIVNALMGLGMSPSSILRYVEELINIVQEERRS